jgi:8-oxo-dGTP pyrophosphatase MutT (NUDIX family)/phosphohistidine phosphatase SixA
VAERVAVVGAEEAVLGLTAAVQAAGGVVVRRIDGHAEVGLVHRPRYDDWSFPKGKLLDGESHIEAALREVSEEAGVECRPGVELLSTTYETDGGAPKVVRYWIMEPTSGTDLNPSQEVDEARWFPVDRAAGQLTHERDRELLAALVARSEPAYLVRHAKAGSRADWEGRDELRPLSTSGRRQAKAIVRAFDGRSVGRILSSPAVRCVETVRPLAAARSRPIEERDELAEGADVGGAQSLLDEIASVPVVFSGHGDLIPALVEAAEGAGAVVEGERGWKKASIWVLERQAGVVVRMRYVPPPRFDGGPSGRSPRRGRGR